MEHRRRLEEALAFFGPSGTGNDEDFAILYEDGRRLIREHLGKMGCPVSDAEDIAQKVFLSVYKGRKRLEFPDLGHWRAYLRSAGVRGFIDISKPETPVGEPEAPAFHPEVVERIARQGRDQKLYEIADQVWLGPKPDRDPDLKILAATYIFVDGQPAKEVLAIVSRRCRDAAPKTEAELLKWASQISVMRRASYNCLYRTKEQLWSMLILAAKQGGNEWKPDDLEFIRHRYRCGTPVAHIPQSVRGVLSSEDISSITARCRAAFPFVNVMTSIWNRLDGHSLRDEVLKKNPLWKRLVFQYHIREELTQDDILERVRDSAAVAGYELNNVNSWVASRLRDEIKSHVLEEIAYD